MRLVCGTHTGGSPFQYVSAEIVLEQLHLPGKRGLRNVQKYADHKPLYRQQQAFDRLNIPISRQTLCDWTGWCSDEVEPVVKAMADYIRGQWLIQSDETSVRMQLPDGQMETARLWAYGLPWAEVVFDFRTDKSQQGPKEFLHRTSAGYL